MRPHRVLAYAFGLVNLQNQRVTADNDCRAVISALRQVALDQPDTTACPETANKFPCVLIDWRNHFPQNAAEVTALSTAKRVPFSGMYTLRDETITIELTDSAGDPAVNSEILSTCTQSRVCNRHGAVDGSARNNLQRNHPHRHHEQLTWRM